MHSAMTMIARMSESAADHGQVRFFIVVRVTGVLLDEAPTQGWAQLAGAGK
jgi:hypothetical protein